MTESIAEKYHAITPQVVFENTKKAIEFYLLMSFD